MNPITIRLTPTETAHLKRRTGKRDAGDALVSLIETTCKGKAPAKAEPKAEAKPEGFAARMARPRRGGRGAGQSGKAPKGALSESGSTIGACRK